MEKFILEKTKFKDVVVITPRVFEDQRGYFCETHNYFNLAQYGFTVNFVQDNESKSKKNVIRGLHYQWDEPMGKLVRVINGSVRDVIVDIRKGSQTYGESLSVVLSDENKKQLWVPPGFAHGVVSLEEGTILSYKCSSVYNQDGESGINPFDKKLNIDWGLPVEEALISEKDLLAKSFDEYTKNAKFNI